MPNIASILPSFNNFLKWPLFAAMAVAGGRAGAQGRDSLQVRPTRIIFGSRQNLELNGTRIAARTDSLLNPELRIGGYVSTYFAHYDDDTEVNNFVQFPTLAPRKDQFSLNMALLSLEYKNQSLRGNLTMHYGDIPESSWPRVFNLIQEARAGFCIYKNLWFDAGFFKTHIGLGSFQPRENITSTMSIPDFYDPYFLSGAKLTYQPTKRLSLQASIFNGYNEYIDNNRNKALGFSANYNLNDNIALTYNFLTCDETPDAVKIKHQRYYHNFYTTFMYSRFSFGVDINYGIQEHTSKKDSAKTASMYAGTLVGKFNFYKQFSIYSRGEYFSDPDRILTGKLDLGSYIKGITAGIEFKPSNTAAFSVEWRLLESEKLIFRQGNYTLNQRNEFIACLDLWF